MNQQEKILCFRFEPLPLNQRSSTMNLKLSLNKTTSKKFNKKNDLNFQIYLSNLRNLLLRAASLLALRTKPSVIIIWTFNLFSNHLKIHERDNYTIVSKTSLKFQKFRSKICVTRKG